MMPRHDPRELPFHLAHSAHFLQRLDRVPRSLTDFALALYRDEDRVRWILHYAHLAKDEERVALALAEGGDGPYIVVTREGKFVTALGEGMKPSDLTVLTRSQVDTFSARVDDARKRLDLAKGVAAPGKRPVDMLGLLTTRPWGLSRDEFSAIAGWVPIMHLRFLTEAFQAASTTSTFRETFLATKGKEFRNHERTRDALLMQWNVAHGIGARYALALMGDLDWVEDFGARWMHDYGPTWTATDQRIISIALRGAWAAARMGKALLPTYRRVLSTTRFPTVTFDAVVALTAIGLRHANLRDQARRLVATAVENADPRLVTWTKEIVATSDLAFDDPESGLETVLSYGRKLVRALGSRSLPDSPYRYSSEADVPREVALVAVANRTFDCLNPTTIQILPWVAKLSSPEGLYPPEGLVRPLRETPTPELVADVYDRQYEGSSPAPATRDPSKAGRNEACSCGSGKKYKKCCGK